MSKLAVRTLSIAGAWELTPRQFGDDRGMFCEWYKSDVLSDLLGHRFDVAQANCSVSRRGVLRGIHFADVPPGQAKYVTCAAGSVLDLVIDIRLGSDTFGEWESVVLDAGQRNAVYLAEGLGHAFLALTDDATVVYLCSTPYAPEREHTITPFDAELAIEWPEGLTPVLSDRDAAAPTLAEAREKGLLPTMSACDAWVEAARHG
jgi:dTDP-4-dehydrorhamnose 3,5-epimerase